MLVNGLSSSSGAVVAFTAIRRMPVVPTDATLAALELNDERESVKVMSALEVAHHLSCEF